MDGMGGGSRFVGIGGIDGIGDSLDFMESVESLGSLSAFYSILCSADVRSAASTAESVGR
jgi:hypothetical protein